MILLIDNYDSFTWNLVQRLGEIDRSLTPGEDLVVVRNDKITPAEAEAMNQGNGPSHVIISPGPCTPNEAGVSADIIEHFAGRIPILGVCLGHQCIADRWGMRVDRHPVIMHGKISQVHHNGQGVFEGLSQPFEATRYHSLVVHRGTIPTEPDADGNGWEVTAWSNESPEHGGLEVVQGIRRVWADTSNAPLEGVQFHPESFLTHEGPLLLWNFLKMGEGKRDVPRPEIALPAASTSEAG